MDFDGVLLRRGEPAWNPLIADMLCHASVAHELWDRMLSAAHRSQFADELGCDGEQAARQVLALLAGVRRVGEASPMHMNGLGSRVHSPALEIARPSWQRGAERSGLTASVLRSRFPAEPVERIGAAVLPRLLGCDCPEVEDGERCTTPTHHGLNLAVHSMLLEDGNERHSDTVAVAARAAGRGPWPAIRKALVNDVARHVGLEPGRVPDLIQPGEGVRSLKRLRHFTGTVARLPVGDPSYGYALPDDPLETLSHRAHRIARTVVAHQARPA
ncbi:hypothetical protein OKJ48_39895 [Streptomyces kunmingensis]|uniref:HD Cas3-type domain-containing protein n=1 Tax=Streptomyces kunmingensis TaxID=68225 RepID=A0ABU6CQN2_9ACTN|nr:HD domain-containing protein [Streptomyces kunmingensis]MEB3966347.1 hypothetical protein [Streptomyces kunmingensis]